MGTPTRKSIEEEARKQYRADVESHEGEMTTEPELNELKEAGYYERAKRKLMRGEPSEARVEREATQRGEETEELRGLYNQASNKIATTQEKIRSGEVKTRPGLGEKLGGALGAFGSRTGSFLSAGAATARTGLGTQVGKYKASRAAKARERAEENIFLEKAQKAGRRRGLYESAYEQGRREARSGQRGGILRALAGAASHIEVRDSEQLSRDLSLGGSRDRRSDFEIGLPERRGSGRAGRNLDDLGLGFAGPRSANGKKKRDPYAELGL